MGFWGSLVLNKTVNDRNSWCHTSQTVDGHVEILNEMVKFFCVHG
jgi:hypothetical protein